MKKAIRYLIIVGISVLVILVVGLVLAGIAGKLIDVLYIFLIILAAFSILSTAALIYRIARVLAFGEAKALDRVTVPMNRPGRSVRRVSRAAPHPALQPRS